MRSGRRRPAAASSAPSLPEPGPEDVDRPALDYRAAMAPHYPLPGMSLYTPRAFLTTRHGVIEIHLDVVEAPLTSLSFVRLAQRGFYDGLTFHRVEPGFVVQGGDPSGDGYGGPGFALRGEVTRRPFGRGSVGMADAGRDTGGSQFFVALSPQPHLDGRYTRFGAVVSGLEVLDLHPPGRRDRAHRGLDRGVKPPGMPASGFSPSTSTAPFSPANRDGLSPHPRRASTPPVPPGCGSSS